MIKMGLASVGMRAMSADDIFSSRLKLLIIMAKAYLRDCPLGTYRKKAVIENANHVFYHSLHLVSESSTLKDNGSEPQTEIVSQKKTSEEHLFHQRVQLLAVMAKALAEDRLRGHFRKKALIDNLNQICETLIFKFQIRDVNFLKVA
ncbi:MAG: hypothetical protein JRF31_00115 [Deltaproteobacteria bacterium]|nr:hypothetical protein [Deltaproteobacteria bacterium]MBW2319267.1 hypothetical protein [Deltaproteobacteria bacterium]